MRLIVQLLSRLVRGAGLMLGLAGLGLALASLGGAWSDRLDALTHAAPLWLLMGVGAVALSAIFARGGERARRLPERAVQTRELFFALRQRLGGGAAFALDLGDLIQQAGAAPCDFIGTMGQRFELLLGRFAPLGEF